MSSVPMSGRFGRATIKDPRAIMVIDSPGCSWSRCRFCAIHNATATEKEALAQLRYCFDQLNNQDVKVQIVCSASFSDYSRNVKNAIFYEIFKRPYIKDVIIEQRWSMRDDIVLYRNRCNREGVTLHAILGLEVVSYEGQKRLGKDACLSVTEARMYYDYVNLLLGVTTEDDTRTLQDRWYTFRDDFQFCKESFTDLSINVFEAVPCTEFIRDTELIEFFYSSAIFQNLIKPNNHIHVYDSDPRADNDFGDIDTFERS